jgi:hypothetical protein
MPTIRQYPLHDKLMGGVDTTLPANLIGADQWRTQHNFRLTPALTQIPRKILVSSIISSEDVRWMGIVPSANPGFGTFVYLTESGIFDSNNPSTPFVTLVKDGNYHRWAVQLYGGRLFYTNEINPLRVNAGVSDTPLLNAPAGRYLAFWYDHVVVGSPTGFPNRIQFSDVYDFTKWTPDATNEADYYDFVEWQQTDFPFTGVTGIGKLKGTLWVYTPTAIIPVSYVGKPKVIKVEEEGIITRIGNTFPWTLVCLDTVHFFFDYLEMMFFVFDGSTCIPVGEPVRQYLMDNLTTNISFATRMYGYIDSVNREIWWPFVSNKNSNTGLFDKAVVFNYRYRKWSTASVSNVQCFSVGGQLAQVISSLQGTIGNLKGNITSLRSAGIISSRLYGTNNGQLLTDDFPGFTTTAPIPYSDSFGLYDTPVLETGDFVYGDIRNVKETDVMVLNSAFQLELQSTLNLPPTPPMAEVDVFVSGRDYLGDAPSYPQTPNAQWMPNLQDGLASYQGSVKGRVLRYKFVFNNTRFATMSAFSEGLVQLKAEK